MRHWELSYLRHGQSVPDGWELVADFDNCHHGRYSQGIIRKLPEADNRCPFCGEPDYKTHDVHGHTQTFCCGNTLSTCCPGASEGETG